MKTIRLDGTIGYEILASDIAEKIEDDDEIHLVINSGGGSILEGFAIYNLLNDARKAGKKISAKVDFAASMASVIVMAADKITMRGNSSLMMIHKPWTGAVGDADELRSQADVLDKMESMLKSIYKGRVGKNVTPKQLDDMLKAETWLSGNEAVTLGFADEIEKDAPKNAMKSALMAMHCQEKIHFDLAKMAAKIEEIEQEKPSFGAILEKCEKLCDIENAMRDRFGASQAEATAIVAAVKRITGTVMVDSEKVLRNHFENFIKNIDHHIKGA